MPQSIKSNRHIHFVDGNWYTDEEYIEYANSVSFYERQDEDEEPFTTVQQAREYFMNFADKSNQAIYNLNDTPYNENEIVHLAQEMASEFNDGETITDIGNINDALRFFSDNEITISRTVKLEDGGTIEDMTPRQYFASLDLSQLPQEAQTLIKEDILAGDEIDSLDTSDEDFVEARRKIDAIVAKQAAPSGTSSDNPTIIKLNKEIQDLTELLEMEDDKAIIKKLENEINDLNELIELEA